MQEIDPLTVREPWQRNLLDGDSAEAIRGRAGNDRTHARHERLRAEPLDRLPADEGDELELRRRPCQRRYEPPRVRLHPARLPGHEEERVQPDPPQGRHGEIMARGAT